MKKNKSDNIDPCVRQTLEYAEAKELLESRESLRERIETLDEGLRLLRRLSPSAVVLAKQDQQQNALDAPVQNVNARLAADESKPRFEVDKRRRRGPTKKALYCSSRDLI